MIAFKAIGYFLERVQALKDVKRGVYATVEDEVKGYRGCEVDVAVFAR